MGAFKKKATRALRSAKSWFKGKGGKSTSSVDLGSEVSTMDESVSVSSPGVEKTAGMEDEPVLFEEVQEERKSIGGQVGWGEVGGCSRELGM